MQLIKKADRVGFSGSRSVPCPASERAIAAACNAISPGCSVSVGCQRGVDAIVRSLVPSAKVFEAKDFGVGKGAYARRSIACVESVMDGGVWVSFPAGECPTGLVPSPDSSRCFSGWGSGTWASAAYAAGLKIPIMLFLPAGSPPAGWGFSWLAGGWFVLWPAGRQLSLF